MPLFAYEAVVAKCRGLFGKMLRPDQMDELLRCSSVTAIAEYLSEKTSYSEILREVITTEVHRGQLEFSLQKQLFNEYTRLYTFTTGVQRDFIGCMMSKYELEYILESIRSVHTKHDQNFFSVPVFLTEHSRIDFRKLYASQSSADILKAIEGTLYHRILLRLLEENENPPYTDIESALVDNYYDRLYNIYAGQFDGSTARSLREVIGIQADLINIMRIARLKRYFDVPPEDILPLLLPLGLKLRSSDVKSLINQKLPQEMSDFLQGLYFGKKMPFGDNPTVDEYMGNFLYRYYRHVIQASKGGFDIILCYLSLKEIEVKNLITIIEGARYSLPFDQIRRYLIGLTVAN